MFINIRTLPRGRSILEQSVAMTQPQVEESGIEGKVSCRAEIDALQYQIHLVVSYSCRVGLNCSRCLKHFSLPVKGGCRVILQNEEAPEAERASEEDVDFYFGSEDDVVDIRPALFDEIVLSLPMMPLCSTECRGIESAKSDKGSEIDPRWEALRKLKEKTKR